MVGMRNAPKRDEWRQVAHTLLAPGEDVSALLRILAVDRTWYNGGVMYGLVSALQHARDAWSRELAT